MSIAGETLREIAIKVSQYFLDFLESDFKRQQAPRRRVVLQTEAGFRSAMRIAAYPGLQHNIWQILGKNSGDALALKFQPKIYSRPISLALKGIIREQIQVIAETELTKTRNAVLECARTTRSIAIENPEEWVDSVRMALAEEVGANIVRPLLALLDGPLSQQAYSAHDSIYSAEAELIELVSAKADFVLPEVLGQYLATGSSDAMAIAMTEMLDLDDIRDSLMGYFENFMAADAFLEFRDLDTYALTGENLQLYLYIGQLKYSNLSYPLFYVPIEVDRLPGGGYVLNLLNHLYANKRAIDFVLQELGERQKRQWLSPIKERISYLAPEQSIAEIANVLFRQIATAMDLGGEIELEAGSMREASTTHVSLTTALHIAVFDRADEALLNDYEEMISQARKNEPGVINLFEGIVSGVLLDNPQSIHREVDEEWSNQALVDRVVIDSPVPLNEEQIKILAAIRNPAARIVVVEGPPGTGKSHTITAIAADCALRGRSCLILSDKAEALNVVQTKLSDTMSQVRHDKGFVNPILRLGQDQANFKRLTSQQTLTQVSAYVKAGKANEIKIQNQLQSIRDDLKDRIEKTVESFSELSIADIGSFHRSEKALEELDPDAAASLQIVNGAILIPVLNDIAKCKDQFIAYMREAFESVQRAQCDEPNIERQSKIDCAIISLSNSVDAKALRLFDRLTKTDLDKLASWILEYDHQRMPVFGYLFRGKAVKNIELVLNSELRPNRVVKIRNERETIQQILKEGALIRQTLGVYGLGDDDLPQVYETLSVSREPSQGAPLARTLFGELKNFFPSGLPAGLIEGTPIELATRWSIAIDYLRGWISTTSSFRNAPDFDYVGSKSKIEQLNVAVMNAEVDTRLVSFMHDFRADAKILASVISNRQKFPEEKFENVKNAFPVIIANIRQFGEYMPLAPDVFDVVVIDEASQVSVAQAFPAMLRAKKLVVLGDTKQFSNTKSSNASIALNEKYRADLEAYFRQNVSQEASMLARLSKFDVKCSILDFCQLCANYSTMLRKHFRSYQELISYSSQTFYSSQLQAIKIRGVPIDDVIRFDEIDVGEARTTRGTNEAEAQFILERLIELLDEEEPPTVGVITPFREQQTLLSKMLFSHAFGAEFQDRLRLKVMTFDSCQGEERKIIFYSMVATRTEDALNYVFPVTLADAEEKVEEKLKVQRLNVGFSRAEEMIWFVLSKPVAEFKGVIGTVLNHYGNILLKGDISAERTDPNSPMEAKVLDWIQKTAFYQSHRNQIEILPQFPIGDYLRQLDPTYKHPSWRVDFLITFMSDLGLARIVIEYDGFEYHFQKGKNVNTGSHERYMLESDIERQLTLESYGYRFLRINRFNLGSDPIQTLSDRLSGMVEQLSDDGSIAEVEQMQAMAGGLVSKELKPCSKCGAIKPLNDFYDKALNNGSGAVGRVCLNCKQAKNYRSSSNSRGGRSWRRRWRR
jgi:AAA domain